MSYHSTVQINVYPITGILKAYVVYNLAGLSNSDLITCTVSNNGFLVVWFVLVWPLVELTNKGMNLVDGSRV